MARYALLQLDDGTLSGRRVVSAQMMAELHRAEIAVGADWVAAARIQNLHLRLAGSPLTFAECTSFFITSRTPVSGLRSFWHHPLRQAWSSDKRRIESLYRRSESKPS